MLESLGAVQTRLEPAGEMYAHADYEIETIHGRLTLHVYDDWISTRFDRRAKDGLPRWIGGQEPNPYSGKWNHHYTFERTTDLEALDAWMENIRLKIADILPSPPLTPIKE
jgi:hypothetical protein